MQIIIHLLDNITGQIEGILPKEVKNDIIHNCSYEVEGAYFAPQVQSGFWDGYRRLFNETSQKFPLGLFSVVCGILRKHNVSFETQDHRVKPQYSTKNYALKNIQFRPYQTEIIDTCIKCKRGVIEAATGSGKSIMIVALAKALSDLKINIYVHRNTLLRQLEEDFKKQGIPVGIIGDNERSMRNINICSLQTLLRKKDSLKGLKKDQIKRIRDPKRLFTENNLFFIERADVTIWDECHHLASHLFFYIHTIAVNSYLRFGFSATPYRDDNSDLLIQAATGRKLVKYGASELIEQGYLVRPKIFFLKIPSYPGLPKDYRTVYNRAVIENEIRNMMIVDTVRLFIEYDITCLIAVKEVKHGNKIMEYLENEFPDVPIKFIQGEGSTGKEKLQALKDLNDKKIKVVVATTVFGEGINIPSLGALINAKASKSPVDTLQLCGRVLRSDKNKKSVIIVDIADMTTPYLRKHTKARGKILKAEKNFDIVEIKSTADIQFELESISE